ncbi:hypothetical protein HDV00_005417 [Rhizophlyctis rosea]|nr:hypothetical protein HDV00_005417 [Rhizophlyctis rosea]
MAIASRHQWVHVFKPLLVLSLEKFFLAPTLEILASLYRSINAMDLTCMPQLSLVEKTILRSSDDASLFVDVVAEAERRGGGGGGDEGDGAKGSGGRGKNKDGRYFETKVDYEGIKIPMRIPLAVFPEEVGEFTVTKLLTTFPTSSCITPPPSPIPSLRWHNNAPYCWHPHLDSGPQTHPLILLLNALLSEKKVLFLGYGKPSGEVAGYVLAAICLASGGGAVVRGFVERSWPYVSLAGLEGLLEA